MTGTARGAGGLLAQAPLDRLREEARNLAGAFGERAVSSLQDKAQDLTGRLTDYVGQGQGGPGLAAALTGVKGLAEGKSPARSMAGAGLSGLKGTLGGLFGRGAGQDGGGSKNGRRDLKVTNIVESIDVGVPVRTAYDQWTRFTDFPSFMKKVENVEQSSDEKLSWKAQILWSHREWESTIVQQVPEEAIVWRSKGAKGHVDGAVSFHELAPRLTRILVVLEYHPQGLFERTGNIWRAQGRRARLELKHFRRHLMTRVILHPEEVEGWRGVIEDGEVVKDQQTALDEESRGQTEDQGEEAYGEDEYDEGGTYEEEDDEAYAGADGQRRRPPPEDGEDAGDLDEGDDWQEAGPGEAEAEYYADGDEPDEDEPDEEGGEFGDAGGDAAGAGRHGRRTETAGTPRSRSASRQGGRRQAPVRREREGANR